MEKFNTTKTKMINAKGTAFAYRELGPHKDIPIIFLHHLTANMDDWDPAVIDGVAKSRHVITFDNRGVGKTEGTTPDNVVEMAKDALDFIVALGFEKIDLFGFSLGGYVAQVLAKENPQLVHKLILAGTGPSGSRSMGSLNIVFQEMLQKAAAENKHPKHFLFFSQSETGQLAAKEFLIRLSERKEDIDNQLSEQSIGAQFTAIAKWSASELFPMSDIKQPTLIVNGDHDIVVPTSDTFKLFDGIPNSQLAIYPDSGHGGIFQYNEFLVKEALEFLKS